MKARCGIFSTVLLAIILFLDKNYSGEDVDAFLEKESGKFSVGLNNVIFHNNKVIYEFTNRMR